MKVKDQENPNSSELTVIVLLAFSIFILMKFEQTSDVQFPIIAARSNNLESKLQDLAPRIVPWMLFGSYSISMCSLVNLPVAEVSIIGPALLGAGEI